MKLAQTPQMADARDVGEMASAFHPDAISADREVVRLSHPSRVYDAIEAALLYGAGRIPKQDFLSAVDDLGEWLEL